MKALFVGLILSLTPSVASANESVISEIENPRSWVLPGGDYGNQRYSILKQIDRGNVGDLHKAWKFDLGIDRPAAGSPIIVGDLLYVATEYPDIVYALHLGDRYTAAGTLIWKYEPKQDPDVVESGPPDLSVSTMAHAQEKILLYQTDGTLLALDANSGEVSWYLRVGDPSVGDMRAGSVLPVKDKVLVGVVGGRDNRRSRIVTVDIETGEKVWQAWTEGTDDEILADPGRTLKDGSPVGTNSAIVGRDASSSGRAHALGAFAYDANSELVFYSTGTGDGSTENPWSNGVIARSVDDGVARWIAPLPIDEFGALSAGHSLIFGARSFNGRSRPALSVAGPDGAVRSFDIETGARLNRDSNLDASYAQFADEAATGQDEVGRALCPVSPASYSPRTKYDYVVANRICSRSALSGSGDPANLGGITAQYLDNDKPSWTIDEELAIWSGTLATAGDVVFYGTSDGRLKAVDARNGHQLFSTGSEIGYIAGISTFFHENKQYVLASRGKGCGPRCPKSGNCPQQLNNARCCPKSGMCPQGYGSGARITLYALP